MAIFVLTTTTTQPITTPCACARGNNHQIRVDNVHLDERSSPVTSAYMHASLASQTLTLHSVLVLSGKTRGGRVWPTAYTCLDPARQDVVWPIRFVENMITSRSMFILRIAGERRGFLEVDLQFGHFLVSKK